MKLSLLNLKNFLILALAIFANIKAQATTFTAIASGAWSNATTWGVTAPSFTNTTDQIIIPSGITVTMDNNVSLNGAIAQLVVNGTLTSSVSTTLDVSSGSLSGAGTINIGNAVFGAGTVMTFTGSFTANNMTSSTGSLQTSAMLTVTQTLTISAGLLSLQSGSALTLGSNANIILSGGQLVNNGGTLGLSSSYSVQYNSGTLLAGPELSGSGLKDLTINVGSGNTLTLSSDATISGTLTLSSGTFSLGIKNLNLHGDIAASGTGIIKSTSASDINIISSTGISGTLNFGNSSTNALNNLTIDVGALNHAEISGTLSVKGTLNLVSGTLNLTSADLAIAGDIAASGTGKVSSSPTTNIKINSASSVNGALKFATGNNTVNNFTLAIGGGGSIRIASDMNIQGTLDLTSGRLDMGPHRLMIASSGSLNGGSSTAYIATSDSGRVSMALSAGPPSTLFPIGTSAYYYPSNITLNSGSSSGRIDVGVNQNVYSHGTTGFDMSSTQHVVDATWHVSADFTANMNMTLTTSWPLAAEVNGFTRTSVYISHYINGNWDKVLGSAATISGSMYSATRANITSLSPFAVFDQSTATVIDLKEINNAVALYPNPAAEYIMVRNIGDDADPLYVNIIDLKGNVVSTQVINRENSSISLINLSDGCYYIQLHNEKINVTKKFVKM